MPLQYVHILKINNWIVTDSLKFFVVLWEWCKGKMLKFNLEGQKGKGEKFEGDQFKKIMEMLGLLKKKTNMYHQVMSTLYSKVT